MDLPPPPPPLPPAGLDPLLSVEGLADYLGVPRQTIYDWRVAGRGPRAYRVGKRLRFTVADVRAWLDTLADPSPAGTAAPAGSDQTAGPREPVRAVTQPQSATLTADSPFTDLVEYWLADLDLEGRLAISTREGYERNMRTLVLPVFASLTLREIGVARCDAFLKHLAALRTAEAHHLDVEQLLPRLINARPLEDASDIAAVLHHRTEMVLHHLTSRPQHRPPQLVAGLIPHAAGPMADGMRAALDQRQTLIERRAVELARAAPTTAESWTRHLGPPPADPEGRRSWSRDVATIATYRDRHAITRETPLGDRSTADIATAAAALRRIQVTSTAEQHHPRAVAASRRHATERSGPSM